MDRPLPYNLHNRLGLKLPEEKSKVYDQLNSIHEFANRNEMKMNFAKTKIILFNPTESYDFQLGVRVDNNQVEYVDQIKLLGLTIKNNMKWKENTREMVKKANIKLYRIKRLKEILENGNFGIWKFQNMEIHEHGNFGTWKFWNMEILEHGNFRTWKFQNMAILEHGNFGTWKFQNMEILEHENFGTWKFWNMEILENGHFGTWKFRNLEILEHGNFGTRTFRNMDYGKY